MSFRLQNLDTIRADYEIKIDIFYDLSMVTKNDDRII